MIFAVLKQMDRTLRSRILNRHPDFHSSFCFKPTSARDGAVCVPRTPIWLDPPPHVAETVHQTHHPEPFPNKGLPNGTGATDAPREIAGGELATNTGYRNMRSALGGRCERSIIAIEG